MRTRLLEKQALERKDSNQSTSSENSIELQSYMNQGPNSRERALSDTTDGKPDSTPSSTATCKADEEEVFSSVERLGSRMFTAPHHFSCSSILTDFDRRSSLP